MVIADSPKLKKYKKKLSFTKTPGPSNKKKKKLESLSFAIQRHHTSNLHYDFRLKMDDILKTWAIPKGPSTDPSEKRLAILMEDHPLNYIDFKGTILDDEYGVGEVIVRDGGTYRNLRKENEGDGLSMADSFDDGRVEVWLEGKKLKGGYVLKRTGKKDSVQWLFIKMKDDEANARRKPCRTETKSIRSDLIINRMKRKNLDDVSLIVRKNNSIPQHNLHKMM
jgi:DNA ligase D-like protein (predicted 3'-phosphoesterase)